MKKARFWSVCRTKGWQTVMAHLYGGDGPGQDFMRLWPKVATLCTYD